MHTLEIESKKITVFGSESKDSPLVVLNTYGGEGESVWNECQALGCPPFTLAAVSNLDWNADMSPWENPPIYKNGEAFSGGANAYIDLLTGKIVPAVSNTISTETKPSFIALAGYSLAGLFALYTAHKTNVFSRIASASGSLWFPDFVKYAESNEFVRKPDCIYLSLGDTETKARNEVLRSVQENTERLCAFWKSKGIHATFELNKGNHFVDSEIRMARGIKWILEH
ncbi:MAG: hypothetical protein IJ158_06225 [Treponema sp.]|nr:hypothetical protein [Treponema sp.]